jgi:hypothetical protein
MTTKTRTRDIDRARDRLAMVALLGLIAAGGLAFFFGKDLNAIQVGLLTLIVTGLSGKSHAAFSWFFDGVPEDDPPTDASGTPVVKVDDSPPIAVKPVEGGATTT